MFFNWNTRQIRNRGNHEEETATKGVSVTKVPTLHPSIIVFM